MTGIKRKIFFIALGISLVSLTAFCAAAFWGLFSIQSEVRKSSAELGDFAAENSSQFLEIEILDKMMAEARNQSLIINERLLSITRDAQYFSNFVTEIYRYSSELPAISIPYSSTANNGKLAMQLHSANGRADYQRIRRETELLGNVKAVFESNKDDMDDMTTAVYLGTESGFIISYDIYSHDDNQAIDPRTRPWYIGAKNQNNTFWTPPYIGADSGKPVITCAYPIYNTEGKFCGVIGIDVLVEDLNGEIVNIKTSEGGFAFITDKEGTLVSLSVRDIPEDIINIAIEEITPGARGFTKLFAGDIEMLLVYSPIPATGWSLAILQPLSMIMEIVTENSEAISKVTQETGEYVNSIIRLIIFIFIGIFIIIVIAIAILSSKLSTKIARPVDVLEAELNVATNIQASMLPSIFPAFPDRNEFDIYASMQPAKEVGGDFYDFFIINNNTLAVVMADVSGKGVPAALFMVIAKTLIKNNAQSGKSPEQVFNAVNNLLCENNDACMFVTAFMGYLDISQGKFTYVNAGHNPPLLKRADSDFEWLSVKPGFVLAAMEDMQYKQDEITLSKDDVLFLYTDGVTEAFNNKGEQFSEERLVKSVNKNHNAGLKEFLLGIKNEIDIFAAGTEQADDITMLILKYKGC